MKLKNLKPRMVIIRANRPKKTDDQTQSEFLAIKPDVDDCIRLLPAGTIEIPSELVNSNSILLKMIENDEIKILSEEDKPATPKKTAAQIEAQKKTPPKAKTASNPSKQDFLDSLPDDVDELIDLAELEHGLTLSRKKGIDKLKEQIYQHAHS